MAPLRPLPKKNAIPSRSSMKKSEPSVQRGSDKAPASGSLFPENKIDKRRMKHAQFVSKIVKTHAPKQRRRRPNKKLVTTLDSLADALPDDDSADSASEGRPNNKNLDQQVNIIKRQSMKSSRGALKKKQKLDNNERDRFAKNLAQMAATSGESNQSNAAQMQSTSSSISRLRNLRGFIAQTLEKKPGLQ